MSSSSSSSSSSSPRPHLKTTTTATDVSSNGIGRKSKKSSVKIENNSVGAPSENQASSNSNSVLSKEKKPRSRRGEGHANRSEGSSHNKDRKPRRKAKEDHFDASLLLDPNLDDHQDHNDTQSKDLEKNVEKEPLVPKDSSKSSKPKDKSRSSSDSMGSLDEHIVPKAGGRSKKKKSPSLGKLQKSSKSAELLKVKVDKAQGLKRGDVFTIERDFKEGGVVKFQTAVPKDLQHVIDAKDFSATIDTINNYFKTAEKVNCGAVTESMLGCLTCFMYNSFCSSSYEKIVDSIEDFIDTENERYYVTKGVQILYPRRTGYLNIKIVVLNNIPPAT
jgi:hypothetical protein